MRGVSSSRRIGVSLGRLQSAEREATVPEIPDEFQKALISWRPSIFNEPGEDHEAHRETLDEAVAAALVAGMPSE